jgi:hypothetical protein
MLLALDFAQKLFSRYAHQPRLRFFVPVTICRFLDSTKRMNIRVSRSHYFHPLSTHEKKMSHLEQRHVPYSDQEAHRLLKVCERVKQKLIGQKEEELRTVTATEQHHRRGKGGKKKIGNSSYLFVVGAEASYVDGRDGAIDRRGARERRDDPPVDGHACVEPRTVEADVSRGD